MKKKYKILLSIILITTLSLNNQLKVNAESILNCNTTLKKGTANTSALTLQKKLNKTVKCNLETDGVFGSKTKSCVIKFQTKYNLKKDGIVGTETCTKLNNLTQDKNTYIIITTQELNVRQTASKDSNIISTVKLGSKHKIYKAVKNSGKTWYKIKTNGTYGYISGNYANKTAIVLDISKQNLILYKNGKVILDTNVVTGNKGNHDTPTGHYTVKEYNKTTNRTLRGTNDNGTKYAAHVDYWMPFITSRAIGFHDASWRSNSEYNTSTYKTNGSHGCVNMMHEDAKTLYNNITGTIDVIVKK